MSDSEEKVLDAENWKSEANAVINDIKHHVKLANISDKIESNDKHIYLNFTTLEGRKLCVELSGLGFRILGNDHDLRNSDSQEYFETPYSLLSSVSPSYSLSFGNALLDKLNKLHNTEKQ